MCTAPQDWGLPQGLLLSLPVPTASSPVGHASPRPSSRVLPPEGTLACPRVGLSHEGRVLGSSQTDISLCPTKGLGFAATAGGCFRVSVLPVISLV